MKALTCILIIILAAPLLNLRAQDYLISFTGSGEVTTLDSVLVENLIQNTTLRMKGSDVLHLLGAVSVFETSGNNEPGKIVLSPNPMMGNTRMQFFLTCPGETNISLLDLSGRILAQVRDFLSAGQHNYNIRAGKEGIYFVRIISGKYSTSGKLICSGSDNKDARIDYESTIASLEKNVDVKSNNEQKIMQYNSGDKLKLTGISGNYSTVVVDIPLSDKTIIFNFFACTDKDGNNYPVVLIGSDKGDVVDKQGEGGNLQIWMGKNLAYLPKVSKPDEQILKDPFYYVYDYYGRDIAEAKASYNYKHYGVLYNWIAALGACPVGWHLPSDEEWTSLEDYLLATGHNWDGSLDLEAVASSLATHHGWKISSVPGSPGCPIEYKKNLTGFSAPPCGFKSEYEFTRINEDIFFWSATEKINYTQLVWYRHISYSSTNVMRNSVHKGYGFSVRCIKDYGAR